MKLYALPLSRRPATALQSTPLFYLHAQRLPKSVGEANPTSSSRSVPLLTRATEKAASFWSGFGSAKEGSWKRKVYVAGDKFMDRIEFEEWSLKAIDPALAPTPWSRLSNDAGEQAFAMGGKKKLERVTLLYPPSLIESGPLLKSLKEQLAHRGPYHRSAMRKCLIGAPFTLPFAIVPVVPNFPLFYVLWRAWSHWRAYQSTKYLQELLSTSQVAFKPSAALDQIYAAAHPTRSSSMPSETSATSSVGSDSSSAPSSSSSSTSNSSTQLEELLLTLDTVPAIVAEFGFSEDEAAALRRSVVQAEKRLRTEHGESSPASTSEGAAGAETTGTEAKDKKL